MTNTQCEDYPACGHEAGDCDGSLYGSDDSIKAQVETTWATGHGYCDHQEGIYNCSEAEYDEDDLDGDSDDSYEMEDAFIDANND